MAAKSNQILTKFETKSSRVKGLAFHPKRKWVLASLHNGVIQLWDYSERILIDKFDEHKGPVRGIDFHRHQPLFVSGGDDTKLKVWNYKSRRCIWTQDGAHEDYIRTTFFHNEHPWIISSSDDQSIRIWNWQSRTRISCLTGHTHYVMCAQFSPKNDLILSASIDQTIRLWDILPLQKSSSTNRNKDDISGLSDILLTKSDYGYESKDAHMAEVNWCCFHPERDICLSAADDNTVKVWQIDSRFSLRELFTIRGHYNNVNCAIFHPTENLLLSASEDKSIRVWDMERRLAITTFRKEHDRFWVLAAHPRDNLFAAGHDTGFMIFKLKRERPEKAKLDNFGASRFEAKYVVTSSNKKYQAYIGYRKPTAANNYDVASWIKICDAASNVLATINEHRKIKSAAWDASGVLVYNTPVHVKYALPDGHCTTIVSVAETLYITGVKEGKIQCLDRKGALKQIPIDVREFNFKLAVIRKDRAGILKSLKQLGTLTRTEICFLVQKGYPGLALKFVKDAPTRFPLAIQAFDIDDALESAAKINDVQCWEKLAEAAMKVGHVKAAERAYKELQLPYKLAMLYLVNGQKTKMAEARDLANHMGDSSTEFIISLLMKDFAQCARIIRKFYPNLAYVCAINHGLYDLALEICEDLSEEQLMLLPSLEEAQKNRSWMQDSGPDLPDAPFENWPHVNDDEESFEAVLADDGPEFEAEEGDEWGDEEFKPSPEHEQEDEIQGLDDVQEGGWSDGEPLEDLLDDEDDFEESQPEQKSERHEKTLSKAQFVAPSVGDSVTSEWKRTSHLALHHVLAGSYKSAFRLLEKQIGAKNPEVLIETFRELSCQSRVAHGSAALHPTLFIHPTRNSRPAGGYELDELRQRLNESFKLFTTGKFIDAIDSFRNVLLAVPFLNIYNSDESSELDADSLLDEAMELVRVCKEYILALQVWLERKNITGKEFADHKRACELAAYFTKLDLKKHRSKVLEKAFEVFLTRPKEFQKTEAATSIARRLLDHVSDPKKSKLVPYAEKVKNAFDVQVDQEINLEYDAKNPYKLCAATFKPIYDGNDGVDCPLCFARYKLEFSGEICRVCTLSEIGKLCDGLQLKHPSK